MQVLLLKEVEKEYSASSLLKLQMKVSAFASSGSSAVGGMIDTGTYGK